MNPIKKIISLSIVILLSYSIYGQNELNPYKYIIVPKKYEFLKSENQYRVNSYVNHLFEKEGYNTLYEGENYPDDLLQNPCLGLKAMVSDDSSAFTTKVYIYLRNCNDQVVFRTEQGKSKVKDLNKTYVDALNKCFVEIKSLDYSYDPVIAMNSTGIGASRNETRASKNEPGETILVASTKTKETEVAGEQAQEPISKNQDKAPKQTSLTSVESEVSAVPVAVAAVAGREVNEPVVNNEPVENNPPVENKAPIESKDPLESKDGIEKGIGEEINSEDEIAVMGEQVIEEEEEKKVSSPMARAFKNATISFLLVDQGAQLQAFVSQSKNNNYKPGELIGTFKRTSLPNVFRVSWKKPQEGSEETTAYFDDEGNLNIDILKDGQIEVIKFEEIK
ncbi:MAG: hypothetical protein JSV73_06820 [Flavobacteriaceae bacterium]|nr:MAG: hypothetical protein JSV73_06820 [Flavobacteriaceae bacterium]